MIRFPGGGRGSLQSLFAVDQPCGDAGLGNGGVQTSVSLGHEEPVCGQSQTSLVRNAPVSAHGLELAWSATTKLCSLKPAAQRHSGVRSLASSATNLTDVAN